MERLRLTLRTLLEAALLLSALAAAGAQNIQPTATGPASGGLISAALPSNVQTISSTAVEAQKKQGDLENVPRVPGMGSLLQGLNAGITFSGVHNSQIGWYEAMVPALSYALNPHYSADVSTTLYLHHLVENENPATSGNQRLALDAADAGDTLIGLHGSFHPHGLGEMATVSLSAPTGNSSDGLGTGRVTFDFDNHTEKFFGHSGLHLDLGMGDSSTLANNLVMRDYNSLGTLTHFQTGATLWGKNYSYIDVSPYEQLPIGSQKVYTVFYQQQDGSPLGSHAVLQTVQGGLSEDNGITTSFGMPLTSHILFSGYYNRSLRQHQDTVSFSMTFVLRSLPLKTKLSLVDRALREAAGLPADPDQ
jgi:hypothetical protein